MKLLMLLSVLASVTLQAHSLCNTCSAASNLACVDKDKFKVCSDGVPLAPPISCPTGTVCTANKQACGPVETSVPACNMCNVCNEAKTIGCTGYNSFGLCLGNDVPDKSASYTCPDGLVCNIDAPTICTDKNITGIGSTCPWSTIVTTTEAPLTTIPTTTTVDPATDPDQFCTSKAVRGRFEILDDTTCKQYINCFNSNGLWYGNIYICPAMTYFNNATQMCGKAVPDRCAGSG